MILDLNSIKIEQGESNTHCSPRLPRVCYGKIPVDGLFSLHFPCIQRQRRPCQLKQMVIQLFGNKFEKYLTQLFAPCHPLLHCIVQLDNFLPLMCCYLCLWRRFDSSCEWQKNKLYLKWKHCMCQFISYMLVPVCRRVLYLNNSVSAGSILDRGDAAPAYEKAPSIDQ